jgi:hypothetical protein
MLSVKTIRKNIKSLESKKQQIEIQIKGFQSMLTNSKTSSTPTKTYSKHKLSWTPERKLMHGNKMKEAWRRRKKVVKLKRVA